MTGPAPWKRLRDLEPPLGSARRVRAGVEQEIDRRSLGRRVAGAGSGRGQQTALMLVAAAGAAAALAWWLSADPGSGDDAVADSAGERNAGPAARASEDRPPAPTADSTAVGRRAPNSGPTAEPLSHDGMPEIRVRDGQRIAVDFAGADVQVSGPAAVRVGSRVLVVRQGRVEVAGYAVVRGPTCTARIDGRARVDVTADGLQARLFAGTADVTPAMDGCQLIELFEDTAGAGAAAKQPGDSGAAQRPQASAPRPAPIGPTKAPRVSASRAGPVTRGAGPDAAAETREISAAEPTPSTGSELRAEIEAYRRARTISRTDASSALTAWREIVRRWPDGALREEADAAIIDALTTLGRADQARAAAKEFLLRHPRSARRATMRALAGGSR